MPGKQRKDKIRMARCANMEGYEKNLQGGHYNDEPRAQEMYDREKALCDEIANWIRKDREKIVNLILSPQGTSRGYLDKWVRYANAKGMPMLPEEYANEADREDKLRKNCLAIVEKVETDTSTNTKNVLTTLKGNVYYEKKSDKQLVPTLLPNGEVDRVMRIWDVMEEAASKVMGSTRLGRNSLVQLGLGYAHPNEL